MEVLILADDFTGALDTASLFGYGTFVLVDRGFQVKARVIAVSSNSRLLQAEKAKQEVASILSLFEKPRHLYKKVDSTMRGNVGAELEVVHKYTGEAIPFTPALPEQGRTVKEGHLFVWGVPLHETQYVDELPVRSSNILELLRVNSSTEIGFWKEGDSSILVFRNVRDRSELREYFESLVGEGYDSIMGGSAGLALELSSYIGFTAPDRPSPDGPILFVSGSRNPVTREQLQEISRWVEVLELKVDSEIETAVNLLKAGRDLAITVDLGDDGSRLLKELARWIIESKQIGGLVIIGGETMRYLLEFLRVKAIEIGESPEVGISAGWMRGGPMDNTPLVSKAGGFGGKDSLVKIWRWFR